MKMQDSNIDIEKLSDDLVSIGNFLQTLSKDLEKATTTQEALLQNIESDLLLQDNIDTLYNSVEQIESDLCKNLGELESIHDKLKKFQTEDLPPLETNYQSLKDEYKEIQDMTDKINKQIDTLKDFTNLNS